MLILPIHPELKYSEEDDVFISKESIGLRPDQSLDIQVVSVESEKRRKKIVKLNSDKPKLRLPKLQEEAGPSSKKCRKITDSHGKFKYQRKCSLNLNNVSKNIAYGKHWNFRNWNFCDNFSSLPCTC